METTKNGIYWVNVVEAPVSVYAVTGENERELVATFEEPGTHSFPAMSSQTEFEGGKVGVITGPFDSTRTLGGKGGAGTPLSPAEQSALTKLVGGTVAANGITLAFKLTDDQKKIVTLTGLDELNTGGAPINTLNGNVYHGSGSANFTETISGQIYQTSIDAHHVECRWNGELKVHLHADANGNAVLDLNGSRVLTEAGDRILTQATGSTDPIPMQHTVWHKIDSAAQAVELSASNDSNRALSMQLMLTPTNNMESGWLTAGDAALEWTYGEPVILSGHTYIIGVTQIAPDKILANLLATF